MYKIPLSIGDIIYTGKFLNKKTTVQSFGTNEHGQPMVNDKPMLKFRIAKLMKKNENKQMKKSELRQLIKEVIKETLLKEKIAKRGDKWVVLSSDDKTLGTHDTKEEATKQLQAIEISKHKV